MYNVTSKTFIIIALLFACVSCADKEKEGASELYTQCNEAISQKNYAGALVLLDTLNTRYPKQTEIRRQAMALKAKAMEGIALDSISVADAALAQATITCEEWLPKFRHVDSSVGLEGYFLPNGIDEKVMTGNAVQARVSDKGYFYMVVNVQGKSIGLNSLELCSGADCITSSAISAARVIKVEGSESASFNPEELEGFGEWLRRNPKPDKAVLVGTKGKVTVKLTPKQAAEIADCYEFSQALLNMRSASIKREKFERMLATARDQIANLAPVPAAQ